MPDGAAKLLSLDEAAAYLNCCPKTLRGHIEAGEILYVRIGKRRKFMAEDLDAFLLSRKEKCPSLSAATSGITVSKSTATGSVVLLSQRTRPRRREYTQS